MKRGTRVKGYRVRQDGRGKITLEPIPYYFAHDASSKIRMRKSKRARPLKQGEMALYHMVRGK